MWDRRKRLYRRFVLIAGCFAQAKTKEFDDALTKAVFRFHRRRREQFLKQVANFFCGSSPPPS
jgi:hypothetical protein